MFPSTNNSTSLEFTHTCCESDYLIYSQTVTTFADFIFISIALQHTIDILGHIRTLDHFVR